MRYRAGVVRARRARGLAPSCSGYTAQAVPRAIEFVRPRTTWRLPRVAVAAQTKLIANKIENKKKLKIKI